MLVRIVINVPDESFVGPGEPVELPCSSDAHQPSTDDDYWTAPGQPVILTMLPTEQEHHAVTKQQGDIQGKEYEEKHTGCFAVSKKG